MKILINNKFLITTLLILIIIYGLNLNYTNDNENEKTSYLIDIFNRDMVSDYTSSNYYSHTVFVGVGTSQNCKPCDDWNENIYNLYSSGEFDFEYVEMIEFDHDGKVLNEKANEWSESFDIDSYPTSLFDRDYERIIGNHPEDLAENIDICGNRLVNDISANMDLFWLDEGKIQVDINIQNNEQTEYFGHIRAFITEILSRYDTYYGNPYHFGFLDYAYDTNIDIASGDSYSDSVIWDGNEHEDEHGNNFGDIDPDNIQVTLLIFNTIDGYTDETITARVSGNNAPDIPTISGQTNGKANEEYEYKIISNDYNNNDIFFYIDWGDGEVEEWIGPYESGEELYISHLWEDEGTYLIKVKAKDTQDAESLWGTLEVSMPKNKKLNHFPLIQFLSSLSNNIPFIKKLISFIFSL
jgi:hypothetical protein